MTNNYNLSDIEKVPIIKNWINNHMQTEKYRAIVMQKIRRLI